MASDEPQQPARRRFFFEGLDPVKFEAIEREMEQREQLRRSRALAPAQPAAVPESQPADPGAMDWGDVAAGLRHLAGQLRQVAEEGPGPSPG
jgi:MoxR-like ATPase